MKLLSLLLLGLISYYSAAQVNSTIIDGNNCSAKIYDDGRFFNDGIYGGYYVPKNETNQSIFTSSFWFAGQDLNDSLYVAAATYNSGHDFFRGPYSSTNQYSDDLYNLSFDPSLWTVTKEEVDYHILNYNSPGYIIPSSIQNWPSNGDPGLGVNPNLAPFIDMDGDNYYEPEFGEYPDIRGDICTYVILNDSKGIHSESGGEKMNIEVHFMFYQYITNDYLNNTTFINLRVFNRGVTSYRNFKTAHFSDVILGNTLDNCLGTDSLLNLIYVYNEDNIDEQSGAELSYGVNPPAMGIVALSGDVSSMGEYRTLSPVFPYTDESGPMDYWQMMNSTWSNGQAWVYGGTGVPGSVGSTTQETNFLFSGNPYDGIGWTELGESSVGGKRPLLVMDSVYFQPGDVLCYDYAVLYNRNGDHLENVQGVISLADSVKQFFDAQPYNCVQVTADLSEISGDEFNVYPNPSSGIFNIHVPESKAYQIYLYDAFGKLIWSEEISGNKVIDLSNELTSGIYHMTWESSKGISYRQRVILQK